MQHDFSLKAYDFDLPEANIAQRPADKREHSKLLVFDRSADPFGHGRFDDILGYINKGDLLVVNNTKVFPARLNGKKETGGKVEVFLLEYPVDTGQHTGNGWRSKSAPVLIKSSKRPKVSSTIVISDKLTCTVTKLLENGKAEVTLNYPLDESLEELLNQHGQMPLPPYIARKDGTTKEDTKRYQTVYADVPGAVAAPTAGLHFSEELLQKLAKKGVETATITLHVGYGTFAPVRADNINDHVIHSEYANVSEETARKIQETKERGGKIWAVGTTTVRTLEFAVRDTGKIEPLADWCDLYIVPGFEFKVIDHLITNFHLPQSSLLFLVSALCGREKLLQSYQEAIQQGYRFFSYGDAMVIL